MLNLFLVKPKPARPKPNKANVAGSVTADTFTSSIKLPTVPVEGVIVVKEMLDKIESATNDALKVDQSDVL